MTVIDDRRWGGRCRDEPHVCEHAGAMYMTMTMMPPFTTSNVKGRGE